jgi:hypothetical protein
MAKTTPNLKGPSARKYPTLGVCGLDCGFCPRYYTQGASRCPGCGGPDFPSKHPTCSFITCCVKKKGLEVCAECSEFPCAKFKTDAEYQQLEGSASYPPYKTVMRNLRSIKEQGLSPFVAQQKKRIKLLEKMIAGFDDGRSRSFLCRAACLSDLTTLEGALNEAAHKVKADRIQADDTKAKARILREILSR